MPGLVGFVRVEEEVWIGFHPVFQNGKKDLKFYSISIDYYLSNKCKMQVYYFEIP